MRHGGKVWILVPTSNASRLFCSRLSMPGLQVRSNPTRILNQHEGVVLVGQYPVSRTESRPQGDIGSLCVCALLLYVCPRVCRLSFSFPINIVDSLQQLADYKSSGLPFDPALVTNPVQRVQSLPSIIVVAKPPARTAITMDAHRCPASLASRIRLA